MKKPIIITTLLTFAISIVGTSGLFAQDASGQKAKASSLSPVEESVEMEYDDLPDPVRKGLKTDKYAGWEVDKVYKVGKRVAPREDHYTIRFKTSKEMTDVYLDENGNVIDPQDSDNPNSANIGIE